MTDSLGVSCGLSLASGSKWTESRTILASMFTTQKVKQVLLDTYSILYTLPVGSKPEHYINLKVAIYILCSSIKFYSVCNDLLIYIQMIPVVNEGCTRLVQEIAQIAESQDCIDVHKYVHT